MTVQKAPFLDLQVEFRNYRMRTLNLGLCRWLSKMVWSHRLSNHTRSRLSTTAASNTCRGASPLSPRCWSTVAVLRSLPGSVLHSGNLRNTNNLQMNIIYKTLAYTRCKLQNCPKKCRLKSKILSVL